MTVQAVCPQAAALLVCLLVALACAARAEPVRDLYQGEAIVTGQQNIEERRRGFGEALAEAVVKVSGDARLADDPRVVSALKQAEHYVAGFAYEDRLAKKKLMDEQGTRERSYYLRVDFDAHAVDRLLAEVGARPWLADRPRMLVLLVITDSVGTYLLTTDSARGWGQREALAAIARRRGIPAVLPQGQPGAEAAALTKIADAPASAADSDIARRYRAASVLRGRMTMREDGRWDTGWALSLAAPADGQDVAKLSAEPWSSEATTFDRAIAAGLEGSALRLAGLQSPPHGGAQ